MTNDDLFFTLMSIMSIFRREALRKRNIVDRRMKNMRRKVTTIAQHDQNTYFYFIMRFKKKLVVKTFYKRKRMKEIFFYHIDRTCTFPPKNCKYTSYFSKNKIILNHYMK